MALYLAGRREPGDAMHIYDQASKEEDGWPTKCGLVIPFEEMVNAKEGSTPNNICEACTEAAS